MDDKTAVLIEKIAEKLGTTAEHLWGVLLNQAPISGAIDLAVVVGLVTSAAWLLRLVIVKTKRAELNDEYVVAAGVFATAWCAVAGVTSMALAEGIVAAFANPEYWALRRLMTLL